MAAKISLALFFFAAMNLVSSCNDLYFFGNHRNYVSEDAGTIAINVTSRASSNRRAFIEIEPYHVDLNYNAIAGRDYIFETATPSSNVVDFILAAGATRSFNLTIIDNSVAETHVKVIHYHVGVYDTDGTEYCDDGYIFIGDNEGLRFESLEDGIKVSEDEGFAEVCVTYKGDNLPPNISAQVYDYNYGNILQKYHYEYFIGFGGNYPDSIHEVSLRLMISSVNPGPVLVTVETLVGFSFSGFASNDDILMVELPNTLQVVNNTRPNKGIRVFAENQQPIIVRGLNYWRHSSDGFLALPCHHLPVEQYEYYGISYGVGHFVIVGCEDDTVFHFNSLVVELDKMETFFWESSDFTGTRLISNKPLAVFSGARCTNTQDNFCDHLTEQVPPTVLWGRRFLSAPLAKTSTASDLYRVLASDADTEVLVDCGPGGTSMLNLSFPGSWLEITTPAMTYCSIVSNNPIIVMQIALGHRIIGVYLGDPFLMMVPPIEQYSNNYIFNTTSELKLNYVNIFVTSEYFEPGKIFFDEQSLSNSIWNEINISDTEFGYFTYVNITTHGIHKVYHVDRASRLGISLYGFDYNFNSYGYPGGVQLQLAQSDDVLFDARSAKFQMNNGDRVCFNMMVIDDEKVEYDEIFSLGLQSVNDSLNIDENYFDYTLITIQDKIEDFILFGLEKSSYTVIEGDGPLTVCVITSGGDGTEMFTANLSTIIDSTNEDDYEYINTFLIIMANLEKQCFNITIIDNEIAEDYEYFILSLTSLTQISGSKIYEIPTLEATVTIVDDEQICPPCVNGVCNVNTGFCDCLPGYTGAACATDIQECEINNGGCDQICTDFIGGYSCSCREGFTQSGSSCTDIDECGTSGAHGCSQICENTVGSYYCNCNRGFQLENGTTCIDINECDIFPLCGQLCVNTEGSFNCACRNGYQLSGSYFCTDIDECMVDSDNCYKMGPAPSRCINTEGSFSCACDQHVGYRISSNGTTCEDINECEEGSHICSEICINTPGSYECDCPVGYELQRDQISCADIDECKSPMSCQHTCTNTIGSFECSCDQGYTLINGSICEALSCHPVLEAPLNGNIKCDKQMLGGICNVTCNENHTLRGSESRTCLPSLQWTGRPAMCDPPMCPDLSPPENGFVLFPCTREEGHVCRVACAHGFITDGPNNQTCKEDGVGNLMWSDGPKCVEGSQCTPNPCLNGGYCIEDEMGFICVCNGTATGYEGPTCEKIIINFLPLTLGDGESFPVTLQTDVDGVDLKVTVNLDKPRSLRVLDFNGNPTTTGNFVGDEEGVVTVTLPDNTAQHVYNPQQQSLFIVETANETISYFDQFDLPRGLLLPSCCSADITLSCPRSTQSISLLSSCQWDTTNRRVRAFGSIFAQSDNLSLPISLSGFRYRDTPIKQYLNDLRPTQGECTPCGECKTGYTHTAQHTLEFIRSKALAFTFIHNIQKLLPTWLEVYVVPSESSTTLRNDMFAPITLSTEPVWEMEGCEKLTDLVGSRYTVLRYNKELSVVINDQRYNYTTETGNTKGDIMCFVVDLCHGSKSPVYMQISHPINKILVSQYLSQFTNRGWEITINTVSVHTQPNMPKNNSTFWNGRELIGMPNIETDIIVNVEFSIGFDEHKLKLELKYYGEADLDYTNKHGLLDGSMSLLISSKIEGMEQDFKLQGYDKAHGLLHIGGGTGPCISVYGLSFKGSYQPQPGDVFFSRLLRFTEVTESCSFDVFLPLNGSYYPALGVSLHTQCPLLSIGQLVLPEMSHTFTFVGSSNQTCFTDNILGVTNPALVIESDLVNAHLQLGNIFTLQSYSSGPDVVTVFERERSGPVSLFHSVAVTIFGGRFESEARVRNDELTISSSNASVFGYPAEITITAPTIKTDWQDLELTVEGSLIAHGDNSFIEKLTDAVINGLRVLIEAANARKEVVELALSGSTERLLDAERQLNQTLANLSFAEEVQKSAADMIQLARGEKDAIEKAFNASQTELQELMDVDNLCTEEPCKDVCMPGEIYTECTEPVFVEKTGQCPVLVKEKKTIRVRPFYETRTTWRFVTQCILENDQVCIEEECPIGVKRECRGVCIPVDSQVEVFNWRTIEVDVPSFEKCTFRVYNSSVSSKCYKNVTCAVRAPDPSCVISNVRCKAMLQALADNTSTIQNDTRLLFQQLIDARRNLSLAIVAHRRVGVDIQGYEQSINRSLVTLTKLHEARINSENNVKHILDELGPLLSIHEKVKGNNYSEIFNITSAVFNTKLTSNPSSMVFDITFESLLSEPKRINQKSYIYISSQSENINFQRIAGDIIDTTFIGDSMRMQSRVERQSEVDIFSPRQVFASRCAQVFNIQQFFSEIFTKLTEIQDIISSSQEETSQLSESLSQQGPQEDEEFQAYLDLIKNYENLATEAVQALESTIFLEWQASMELLYSESGSVGEVSCDGLADCLQTAVDNLRSLINLTPDSELSPDFLSLRQNFSHIANTLLELAILSNISINEGVSRVAPMVDLITTYTTNNYWCSEPPVITTQLPSQVNVSLGDTLQLSCEAESDLTLTYHWRRFDNVLPGFNTNQLVIDNVQRQDSANYTCFASNPVGIAESVTTSVTVYELPEFYLLPESVVTYLGDGNGAWFACNATAWPYPGWRWYYRSNSNQNWTLIEGEETNELLITNPQEKNQGMYLCEALNYHGSVRSQPVTLTLLPFTVSQHKIPLQFTVFRNKGSCSLADVYDSLYNLLSETISGETAIIDDFNITELDSENFDVSLSLVSRNVTTNYLHFSTFAEIANTALPHARSLRKSIQLIRNLLNEDLQGGIDLGRGSSASGSGSSVQDCFISTIDDSIVMGQLSYVCPPGQRLNSDYLLCVSCEMGHYSAETERSRIVNGVGFTENVPVCSPCPLDSYSDTIGSDTCTQCPRYHSTSSTATASLDLCIPQPLALECETMTTDGHIDIDCRTNRPPQTIFCSFNEGLKHPCSYPVAINIDVSPLGNHSLTIFVEDDEGFQAQTTVAYSLQDDSSPTAPPVVPSLVVKFVKDSPRVQGDSIEADILLSRPVQSLVCRLVIVSKAENFTSEKDCSGGHVMFSGLSPAVYTLRVIATNRKPDKEFIKTRLEITNDTSRCTLHLINDGVSVEGDSATVEFTGRGPVEGYGCQLDRMEFFQCTSPLELSGLNIGRHTLKVVPIGCGRNRMIINTNIFIVE